MADVAGLVREGQRLLKQSKLSSTHRVNAGLKTLGLLPALLSLAEQHEELRQKADGFRIEADRCIFDYDDLEVTAGLRREALEQIAEGRPNQRFDPWAQGVARAALRAEEDAG